MITPKAGRKERLEKIRDEKANKVGAESHQSSKHWRNGDIRRRSMDDLSNTFKTVLKALTECVTHGKFSVFAEDFDCSRV